MMTCNVQEKDGGQWEMAQLYEEDEMQHTSTPERPLRQKRRMSLQSIVCPTECEMEYTSFESETNVKDDPVELCLIGIERAKEMNLYGALKSFTSALYSVSSLPRELTSPRGKKVIPQLDEGLDPFPSYIIPSYATNHDELEVILLYNIGRVYSNYNFSEIAYELYQEAFLLSQSIENRELFPLVGLAFSATCYAENQLGSSIKILRTIVENKSLSLNEKMIAVLHNALGILYFQKESSSISRAKGYIESSLSIHLRIQSPKHVVATVLNNLGRIRFRESDYEDARGLFEQAHSYRKEALGRNHIDVAASLFNLGQTFHKLRLYAEALRSYEEYGQISQSIGVEGHTSSILRCIAEIHEVENRQDEAIAAYLKALKMMDRQEGLNMNIAGVCNRLGNLYFAKKDYDAALQAYQKGLKVEELCAGNHPNTAVTLSNMGKTHKQRGEYDLALAVFKRALKVQERWLGSRHVDVASTLSSMALIEFERERFSRALELYQRALMIHRDICGDLNTEVANLLRRIGRTLGHMNETEHASLSYQESIRILQSMHLSTHFGDMILALNDFGHLKADLGDDDGALECFLESLAIEYRENTTDTSVVATKRLVNTLESIADVYERKGDIRAAEGIHQRVLALHRDSSEVGDTTITLQKLASLSLQYGSVDKAMVYMTACSRILVSRDESIFARPLEGFHLYLFARLHPESAEAA